MFENIYDPSSMARASEVVVGRAEIFLILYSCDWNAAHVDKDAKNAWLDRAFIVQMSSHHR